MLRTVAQRFATAFVVATLTTAMASPALAQDGAPKGAAGTAGGKKSGDPNAGPDGAVRKDPEGIKGISPYTAKLAQGRNLFAAKNHAGALSAFKAAIALDGEKLEAYVLGAQVLFAKGDVKGAAAMLKTGRTKKGLAGTQSKHLFMTGMTVERGADASRTTQAGKLSEVLKSTWEAAKQNWSAYKVFLMAHSGAPDHGATAVERNKKIDARVKLVDDYKIVIQRAADNAKNRKKK